MNNVESKIVFLGTGADSVIIGKQILGSGGVIIKYEDKQLHIDPGPGTLVRAKEEKINLRENTAILVSSPEIFYSNDVNAVINAMTYGGLDAKGVLIGSETFINGDGKENAGLLNSHRRYLEKIIAIKEEQKVGIENIEITGLKTKTKSIGFKITTPAFTIVYSSQIKFDKKIAEQYKDADIIILHLALPDDFKGDTINAKETMELLKGVKPQACVLTGFGKKMLEADAIDQARTIQRATGIQIIAAKDGLKLNPTAYSATIRQRKLPNYKKN